MKHPFCARIRLAVPAAALVFGCMTIQSSQAAASNTAEAAPTVKSMRTDRLNLGVAYYPEHWPERMWADDFRRMRELGLTVIRVGEFAWTVFEPAEGKFDFALFDRALDAAHAAGLKVILGTPTATPPAWLTQKHPEILNAKQDGTLYHHGMRQHVNHSSPVFFEYSARITRAMVEHFKNHPAVIGWQLDNEFNCEMGYFYSEADHVAFRAWAKQKYGTLEALNEAWGTVVWSQTYTDWDQVYLPRVTPANTPNPHLALDEKRYISDQTQRFAAEQARIIREQAPRHFITTNGIFGHLDYQRMTGELLDFISYDSYPQFGRLWPDPGPQPLRDRMSSMSLSLVRAISPNFTVMEQQSGAGGWVNRLAAPEPKPGQMRLWTYQSIAHGADMLLYFRWRTATVGTEIYWHGLNAYDNRPNRRLAELKRTSDELSRIGGDIVGKRYEAAVAIVRDYDNDWDGEHDIWHGPYRAQSTRAWYKALQHLHVPADFVDLRDATALEALKPYRVLVYPHPAILTERRAALLEQYVAQGGTVVFGCRTGYKDIQGRVPMVPMPGPVAKLCGVTVEEFTRLLDGAKVPIAWVEKNNTAAAGGGAAVAGTTSVGGASGGAAARGAAAATGATAASGATAFETDNFNDVLQVEDPTVRVLATYSGEHYAGKPVLTERKHGQGRALYFGAVFNDAVAEKLVSDLGLKSPVAELCTLPREVEVAIRGSGKDRLMFLMNFADGPVKVQFHRAVKDQLSGATWEGARDLAAYEVGVIRLEAE